jgi:hypothetical protein
VEVQSKEGQDEAMTSLSESIEYYLIIQYILRRVRGHNDLSSLQPDTTRLTAVLTWIRFRDLPKLSSSIQTGNVRVSRCSKQRID